jgi:hypothetical protein
MISAPPRVVITGGGGVSPLGTGTERLNACLVLAAFRPTSSHCDGLAPVGSVALIPRKNKATLLYVSF